MNVTQALVTRIAGVEIPVSNLKAAIEWYETILGLEIHDEVQGTWKEAMLHFAGGKSAGIYLVQTDSQERLRFHNTNHGYTQSSIDFYTSDLEAFHRHLKKHGVTTNREIVELQPGEKSGFGFFDPDGNSFGATNVTFEGN